jgi:hypothetical protein
VQFAFLFITAASIHARGIYKNESFHYINRSLIGEVYFRIAGDEMYASL